MRIGIFVVTPGRQGGGPETYEVQLVRALAKLDTTNEYVIYCTQKSAISAINVEQKNFRYCVLRPRLRWLSIPASLPCMLLLHRVDFFHATMIPPPLSPKPYVLTILCSSNWKHPEFYDRKVVWRLNRLISRGLRSASMFLCISRNLLQEVSDDFGVAGSRLRVSYMGVGQEFSPKPIEEARGFLAAQYDLDFPYVLFLGQQQERKNVFRVIEAYARYRAETNSDARLLLVGRNADESGPIYETIRRLGILPHVTRIRYIPHRELPYLYSAAKMVVFPSLWEGFGLPVIESMACGTPVVTSNATCLPEIAGDAAVVAEATSVDEIAAGMIRIEQDPEFRSTLIERGFERARYFSWENCARSTLEAYAAMDAARKKT